MFYECKNLVGGQGTKYDATQVDASYAHADEGSSNPGYLTGDDTSSFYYSYDFEDEEEMGEWTLVDCQEKTNRISNSSAHSDSYVFQFYYSLTPPQYLISPHLSGVGMEGIVTFFYKSQSTSYPESFQVGYSTTTSDVESFTWGDEMTVTSTAWAQYLGKVPAGTQYVAVKYTSYDKYRFYIDDFTFQTLGMKPTLLSVSDVATHSATVSWMSNATGWNVQYKAASESEWTTVPTTQTSCTLSGLRSGTDYEVRVQGDNGQGSTSDWSDIITFSTLPAPTPNLHAQNLTYCSVELICTPGAEDQTAWDLAYKVTQSDEEYTIIEGITDNSYTLTNLTPETSYTVKIRGIYGDEVSDWTNASFTTLEQYPKPTNIAATDITRSAATITWKGSSDTYEMRYRSTKSEATSLYEDFENGLDQWTRYTEGEGDGWTTDAPTTTNAVSGSHVGVTRSWKGTALNADNWLVSPPIDLGGTLQYWVKDDGQYHETYAVLISTTGNAIEDFTTVLLEGDTPTDNWTLKSIDLSAYAGQQGYIAFHHLDYDQNYLMIDDIAVSLSEEEWTTLENVSGTSHRMTGLTPETSYTVQMRSNYGDGNYSKWTDLVFFTTDVKNPVPFDLAVTASTTKAHLSWTGYSDSYKVRYRPIPSGEDFENGLDQWTCYTEGEGDGWTTVSSLTQGWTFDAVSGCYVGMTRSWSSGTALNADNWLVSPQIDLGGTLQYWVRDDGQYHETYAVLISTTGNAIEDFTTVLLEGDTPTDKWTQKSIDLSAYAGQQGYIAFHHVDYDQDYLMIDDITVSPSEGEWTTLENVSGTSCQVTGLTPGTWYEWQVTGVTSGEEDASTKVLMFSTLSQLQGDVNGDGEVNISDVTALVNIILDKSPKNDASDVNGDTDVNISDVTALVNIILNK